MAGLSQNLQLSLPSSPDVAEGPVRADREGGLRHQVNGRRARQAEARNRDRKVLLSGAGNVSRQAERGCPPRRRVARVGRRGSSSDILRGVGGRARMNPMDPDTSQSPAGSGIEVTLRYAGPVNSAELFARESLTMDERASVILRCEKLLIVKSWLAT